MRLVIMVMMMYPSYLTAYKLWKINNRTIADNSLFGATVTSWKQDGKERLFLSSKSSLDSSKPVSNEGIAEVIFISFERVDLVDTV
jgi:D-hexose-6-phosphate mutarotase